MRPYETYSKLEHRQRALFLGCQTKGLEGVHRDIDRMRDMFGAKGFEITCCVGLDATRTGIEDAFKKFIADTRPDDAVVIYYSGHGGLLTDRDANGNPNRRPRTCQFIVPTDFIFPDVGMPLHDFRGITSVELSYFVRCLSNKTVNVATIFDCCHAARMTRDVPIEEDTSSAIRARCLLGRAIPVSVRDHLAGLRAAGLPVPDEPEGNPHVVRLVAAAVEQLAYEVLLPDGSWGGAMSEALLHTLPAVDSSSICWLTLAQHIRETVLQRVPSQRVEIEGPSRRVLFDTREVSLTGVLYYFLDDRGPALRGGEIVGVRIGDEYTIMPLDAELSNDDNKLAVAVVNKVSPGKALVHLEAHRNLPIPLGAPAFPTRKSYRQRPVLFTQGSSLDATLIGAIEASPRLSLTEKQSGAVIAQVAVRDDVIHVHDDQNHEIYDIQRNTSNYQARVVEVLAKLALAADVRELPTGLGPNALPAPPYLEWGLVENGQRKPLSMADEQILQGSRIYISVANVALTPLYLSVLDVGFAGSVAPITINDPSGMRLGPREHYTFGAIDPYGLVGLQITWPHDLPRIGPRRETVVVLATSEPVDMSPLVTGNFSAKAIMRSGIEAEIAQRSTAKARDLALEKLVMQYSVRNIDFYVRPHNG